MSSAASAICSSSLSEQFVHHEHSLQNPRTAGPDRSSCALSTPANNRTSALVYCGVIRRRGRRSICRHRSLLRRWLSRVAWDRLNPVIFASTCGLFLSALCSAVDTLDPSTPLHIGEACHRIDEPTVPTPSGFGHYS